MHATTHTTQHKRALLVLPYLSVVREKATHLHDVLRSAGVTVKGYTSDDTAAPLACRCWWATHHTTPTPACTCSGASTLRCAPSKKPTIA